MRGACLLRGEVVEGAEGRALDGEDVRLIQVDREAEVGQLGGAAPVDEDVRGGHVAVEEALPVQVFQAQGHLARHLRGGRGGQHPAALDELGGALAVDVLHHQEVEPERLPVVVDPDQVLVLELAGDLRLASEPGPPPRAAAPLAREDLDRDVAVQPRVPGEIDLAHPPAAEHAEQVILADDQPFPAAEQELLRLPARQPPAHDRLAGEAAIELLGRAPLRGDRREACLEPPDVDQAAADRGLPEVRGLRIYHDRSRPDPTSSRERGLYAHRPLMLILPSFPRVHLYHLRG